MRMWTSLALLSLAAVSTLSFPHPGPPIPPVGEGTRAQFYVLKPDGTFTYGYNTGDGLHETATKLESGIVEGEFGYTNSDGEYILLQYTAGEGGFVPRGNFLPQPVEVSALSSSQSSLNQYSAPGRAVPAPAPATPVEFAEIRGGIPGADGSYHFSYDTSSSSRSETADADLNIIGHYSFITDDGVSRSVDYKAGSATGFIAEGDHLPKVSDDEFGVRAPSQASVSVPSLAYNNPIASSVNLVATKSSSSSAPRSDASYSFSYDAGDSARSESADADLNIVGSYSFTANDGVSRSVNYQAGSATGFIAEGEHLPKPVDAIAGTGPFATSYQLDPSSVNLIATKSSSSSAPRSDASYSFSYDAGDSARSESADADLNIVGSYSFTADDGVSRSVNYQAGSATGFIAEGEHLPKPVDALAGAGPATTSYQLDPSSVNLVATKSSSSSAPRSDASYSFSYDAGDSARSESADADLNIVGSYSFTADDGVSRSVNYHAGSATGFIAEGDHLPKPVDALAVTGSPDASYQAPIPSSAVKPRFQTSPVAFEEAFIRGGVPGTDGSYHFSYDTSSSSRSESADTLNSVIGSFGFEADDGVHRSIQYTAGAETGFIAEGAHLPVGPSVPGAESGIPTGRILPILSEEEANALAAVTSGAASSSPSLSYGATGASTQLRSSDSSDEDDTTPSDASYSFSFVSDSYSRNEDADVDGNVKGSYTYTGDDGIIRRVDFVAGRETGFVPKGQYTEAAGSSISSASHRTPSSASYSASSTSYQAPAAPASPAVSYIAPSHSSNVATKSSALPTVSGNALDSIVIGDVNLVHANAEASPTMYGYSFCAI